MVICRIVCQCDPPSPSFSSDQVAIQQFNSATYKVCDMIQMQRVFPPLKEGVREGFEEHGKGGQKRVDYVLNAT